MSNKRTLDNITKTIFTRGKVSEKPTENSVCKIIIVKFETEILLDSKYLLHDNLKKEKSFIIGQADTQLDRKLEQCLETMFVEEESCFTICVTNFPVNKTPISYNVTIKLVSLEFHGYFFEWSAEEKIKLALDHKKYGVELFKQNRIVDAFYRFSKAIKLLLTCVLGVDDNSDEIEGVKISEIEDLKLILYGNLASCQLKVQNFEDVIILCNKVLESDNDNVKALYKRGMAYSATRDFEKAHDDLINFLKSEPTHVVANEKLIYINRELAKSHGKYVEFCERIFKS